MSLYRILKRVSYKNRLNRTIPQINFYTYLSQTTWLIIIFYIFYYYMKQFFLPSIFENIRLKNIKPENKLSKSLVSESKNTQLIYNNSITNIL